MLPCGKNCLEHLLKYSLLGPSLGASDSVGLGWAQEYVFLARISGDSYRGSLGNLVFKKPFFRPESRNEAP